MKKIYSYVLMAAALLIGTNVWAIPFPGTTGAELQQAINDAPDNATTTLTLQDKVTVTSSIWLGTENVNDDAKSIILDLNGNDIEMSATANVTYFMFVLSHGSLSIQNSGQRVAQIYLKGTKSSDATSIFTVYGAPTSSAQTENPINTRDNGYFSHLEIGPRVKIVADKGILGTAITVNTYTGATTDALYGKGVSYTTNPDSKSRGWAFGARVDVHGDIDFPGKDGGSYKSYAIKTNGTLGSPQDSVKYFTPAFVNAHKEDTVDVPFVYVHSSANLVTNGASTKSTPIYASGYAKWTVEGHCEGATGAYVSSGIVDFADAVIKSNATVDYATPQSGGSAVAAGSAVVINSRDVYAGGIDVTVSGDSKLTGQSGFAIEETVKTSDTKVESVSIEGGTLEGGDKGAIAASQTTASEEKFVVYGAVVEGEAQVEGQVSENFEEFLPKDEGDNATAHVTIVTDPETGKSTMVISEGGSAPATQTQWSQIAQLPDSANATWTGFVPAVIGDGVKDSTIILGELIINSGNATDGVQQLTIKNKATLQVKSIIMNAYARIIVEPGAKFIVYGKQGINAPAVENIELQASPDAQAIFLFNPEVASNRHPNATVKMLAKQIGRNADHDYFWHRFTTPLNVKVSSWEKEGNLSGTTYPTYIYSWDYANEQWANATVADMEPMHGYSLTLASEYIDGADADGYLNVLQDVTYIFKGELVGNLNKPVAFQSEGFNFFGNSYTANISVKNLIAGLADSHIDGTVYLWCNNEDAPEYQSYVGTSAYMIQRDRGEEWQKQISPMQTFIMRLRGANKANEAVDYASAIWGNPTYSALTAKQGAPRRINEASVNENAYMEIRVKAANGKSDKVNFAETDSNSDAFESGFDVAKYMNKNTINLYSTIDGEDYSSIVTDNIEGKTLSLKTNDELAYTMTFNNVEGNEYALIDKATNAVIAITEGAIYEFTAQPNSTVEGRFEIIGAAKMPTAIENTEVKANVKGIYTLMGQYVGENFDVLPAGVYVVNGVKIVK